MFLPDPSGHRDVALGLARDAGRVLLVHNARSAQGTATRFWDLPGGTVEPGERIVDALLREAREELGVDVEAGPLVVVVDGAKRTRADAPPLYTWRAFVLEMRLPWGAIPVPGPEIERVEWVPDAEARERMSAPYQAPVVARLYGDRSTYARVDWVEEAAAPDGGALAPDVRHLAVIASAAAVGDLDLVASECAAALGDGVPASRVEEALLQVVPYAGFPRALAAFAATAACRGTTSPSSAEAEFPVRTTRGAATFDAVYGDTAERVRHGLSMLHPLLPAWTTEFAYGRVIARPGLELATRELLAVSILAALGRTEDALLGHLRAALRLGASRDAVAGAIAVVPPSAGAGRRAAARAVLARI